jgi:hypothetical protein
MATKEWVITKVAITSLALVSLISICIGGANVLFEVKRGVVRVERDIIQHRNSDDKQWEKVWVKVDANGDSINQLKLDTQKNTQYYMEIMRLIGELKNSNTREFNQLNGKFDTLEVVK